MAATNRPDVLDPALLRPGRFDRKVQIDLPQRQARQQILQVHIRKVPLHDDVDLQVVASRTIGFSGADLANLVNEASLLAARERRRQVTMDCFDRARDRLLLGNLREHGLTAADQARIAYHEAGHALLAWLLPNADPLEKVTIIPRGQALGATEQMPEEDRVNYPQPYLEDCITGMLGGRLAERLIYGEVSTGAEQDLKEATRLARRMVANWGMSETLGPAYFQRGEEHVFLGKEMGQSKDFSEHTAEVIDRELLNLLQRLENRAHELLESHRQGLENLVAKLLQHETLQKEEIREVLRTATPETTDKREPAAAMA